MLIHVEEIIKRSWHLYKENFGLFMQYMAILFGLTMLWFAGGLYTQNLLLSLTDGNPIIPFAVYLIFFAIISLLGLWLTLTFIRVVAKRYVNQPTLPIKKELRDTAPLLLAGIISPILAGLAMIGGLFLFIIPGIIFFVWFAFALYAIAIDKQGIISSLKLSKRLVTGHWWATFWRLIAPMAVFLFIAVVAQSLIRYVGNVLIASIPSPTADLIVFLIVAAIIYAITFLITPLTTAAQAILYLELKHIKQESVTPKK